MGAQDNRQTEGQPSEESKSRGSLKRYQVNSDLNSTPDLRDAGKSSQAKAVLRRKQRSSSDSKRQRSSTSGGQERHKERTSSHSGSPKLSTKSTPFSPQEERTLSSNETRDNGEAANISPHRQKKTTSDKITATSTRQSSRRHKLLAEDEMSNLENIVPTRAIGVAKKTIASRTVGTVARTKGGAVRKSAKTRKK